MPGWDSQGQGVLSVRDISTQSLLVMVVIAVLVLCLQTPKPLNDGQIPATLAFVAFRYQQVHGPAMIASTQTPPVRQSIHA